MQKTQHSRAYRRLLAALRAARVRAGLTQAKVAERVGRHGSFVSKVECGERRLDVVELAQLCAVYRCDLVRLLREAGIVR